MFHRVDFKVELSGVVRININIINEEMSHKSVAVTWTKACNQL
jgi:hypothetical protein